MKSIGVCRLEGSVRKGIAVALLAILLISVGVTKGNCEPPTADSVPVVLVHGLHGGVLDGRLGARDQMRNFASFLERNGLVNNSNMVFVDYSAIKDSGSAFVARNKIGEAIERARALTGAAKVDIVAQGFGALAARRYLDMGGGNVRTLVMVSPPNHGSFVATVMRMGAEVERHAGGAASVRANLAENGNSTEFEGPFLYVERRSVLFYEPLYKEYLLKSKVLVSPWRLPTRDSRGFEEWFAATKPEQYRDAILDAQVPVPGSGLTRAYYELVAMNVARCRVLSSGLGSEGLGAVLLDEPYISTDWRRMLLHYLKKVGIYILERLAQVARARLPSFLAKNAATAVGLDPMGKSVEEMVSETISFPEGRDTFGRPISRSILANHELRCLNEREKERRDRLAAMPEIPLAELPDKNPKYVIVAGRMANLWTALDGSIPDNDAVVTVDSTCLPLYDDDVFHVFGGLFGPNHLSLIGDGRVRNLVLGELRSFRPVVSEHMLAIADAAERAETSSRGGSAVSGRGTAMWSRPGYVRLDFGPCPPVGVAGAAGDKFQVDHRTGDEGDATQAVNVKISCGEAAEASPRVWVYAVRRDGSLVKMVVKAGSADRGMAVFAPRTPRAEPTVQPASSSVLANSGRRPDGLDGPKKTDDAGLVISGIGSEYVGLLIGYRSVGDTEILAETGSSAANSVPVSYTVELLPSGYGSNGTGLESEPNAPGFGDDARTSESPGPDPDPDLSRTGGTSSTRVVKAGADFGGGKTGAGSTGEEEAEVEIVRKPPKLVHVKYRTKRTTLKEESVSCHSEWRWDFGDGTRFVDPDESHTAVEVLHRFDKTGQYRVSATSVDDNGCELRSIEWNVNIDGGAGEPDPFERRFVAQTADAPDVAVWVEGPKRWITGRPATFQVRVTVGDTAYAVRHEVEIDPSPEFMVVWDRPGTYEVVAAVTVKTRYVFPDGEVTIKNTYLGSTWVEVLTTSVTD